MMRRLFRKIANEREKMEEKVLFESSKNFTK